MKDKFSGGVKRASFIEKETDLIVYAEDPKETKKFRPLAVVESDDVAVDDLRKYLPFLEFSMIESDQPVIAVNSLISGVGKSFNLVNLATFYAGLGKKVLLIGADLNKELCIKRAKGFFRSSLGLSNLKQKSCLSKWKIWLCVFLNELPTPAELLSSKLFAELIEKFKQQHDLIVIDMPQNFKDNPNDHVSIVINKYGRRYQDGVGYKYAKCQTQSIAGHFTSNVNFVCDSRSVYFSCFSDRAFETCFAAAECHCGWRPCGASR